MFDIKPSISCVMTTYRRFRCVERSIAMFMAQDYTGDMQLVIFNTDEEYPLELDNCPENIWIINNSIDYRTGEKYTNVGAIRRDAATYAMNEYYICWDDDDIFLPWNNRQCVDGIIRHNKLAWKPMKSFFKTKETISVVQNTLEASVIVKTSELDFALETGSEHLSWYTRLRDMGELIENDARSIPGYCFNWSDDSDVAGHKQSGDINNPDNFENHKKHTQDYASRKLQLLTYEQIKYLYDPFYMFINKNIDQFDLHSQKEYSQGYL